MFRIKRKGETGKKRERGEGSQVGGQGALLGSESQVLAFWTWREK